jgi:hypothetical protein
MAHSITPGPARRNRDSRGQLLEQEPCRVCGRHAMHRARARNLFERVRKLYTPMRPFECHNCGSREWMVALQFPKTTERVEDRFDPTSLDRSLDRTRLNRTPEGER